MSEQPNREHGTESEEHAEGEHSSRSYGRRALMLGAATAGVGAAASLVVGAGPAGAESPTSGAKDVVLSKANKATATTSISMSVDGACGVEGLDKSSGGGYGVYGNSENGTGIYGSITGDTSGHYAVQGVDASTGDGGGAGVGGSSANGTGVIGSSANGTGIHGTITGDTRGHFAVEGVDASTGDGGGAGVGGSSTNGTGVYGTSTNGTGVSGIHSTGVGTGVSGVDNSGNDNSFGVTGSSGNGYGVYGNTTNGIAGVIGDASGTGGSGVYGGADGENGLGVQGASYGPGDSYGVYAYSANSDALYADGSAQVIGSLSKGGGSFRIDHPLDPEDKYLYHSFVESPDMMNVYNGTITLDGDGRATVELPDWFEALNRDYRYQLTALDEPAPDLHISSRVSDRKFSIAGGKAHMEVSWQVTGIRRDLWANANRIPVEVDKKAEDRGRYLHPELFGGEAITALAKTRDRARRHLSNATQL